MAVIPKIPILLFVMHKVAIGAPPIVEGVTADANPK